MKKIPNIWKLNNILPDNPQVKEKNQKGNSNAFWNNDNVPPNI